MFGVFRSPRIRGGVPYIPAEGAPMSVPLFRSLTDVLQALPTYGAHGTAQRCRRDRPPSHPLLPVPPVRFSELRTEGGSPWSSGRTAQPAETFPSGRKTS